MFGRFELHHLAFDVTAKTLLFAEWGISSSANLACLDAARLYPGRQRHRRPISPQGRPPRAAATLDLELIGGTKTSYQLIVEWTLDATPNNPHVRLSTTCPRTSIAREFALIRSLRTVPPAWRNLRPTAAYCRSTGLSPTTPRGHHRRSRVGRRPSALGGAHTGSRRHPLRRGRVPC